MQNKTMTFIWHSPLEIQVLAEDKYINVMGVKLFDGIITPPPSDSLYLQQCRYKQTIKTPIFIYLFILFYFILFYFFIFLMKIMYNLYAYICSFEDNFNTLIYRQ